MHDRLRLQMRNTLPQQESVSAGSICLKAATAGGQQALGKQGSCLEIGQSLDLFTINRFDPFIAGVSDEDLLNAIVFSLPASKIQATFVDGEKIFDQRDTAALESSARDLQQLREKLTF